MMWTTSAMLTSNMSNLNLGIGVKNNLVHIFILKIIPPYNVHCTVSVQLIERVRGTLARTVWEHCKNSARAMQKSTGPLKEQWERNSFVSLPSCAFMNYTTNCSVPLGEIILPFLGWKIYVLIYSYILHILYIQYISLWEECVQGEEYKTWKAFH